MPRKILFCCLLAVFIWAGNTIVTKLAAGNIPPGAIAFWRWLIAFLILTPFVAGSVWRHRAIVRRHLWKLAVLGFLGMAFCQGIAYYAASFTSATNMALLLALIPLMTFALSACLLREWPSTLAIAGGVVSLAGICIVLGKGDPSQLLAHGLGRGDLLMFLAVIALAAYGILLRTWSSPLPTFTSLYVQIAWALVFLLPGFLLERAATFTASNVAILLYAAIAGSIVAPFVWMKAVQRLGANRISIFMNLIPIITAVAAAILLGESLHGYHVVGGGLTLGGIVLNQRHAAPRRSPAQAVAAEG